MTSTVTLAEVIACIRDSQGIKEAKPISEATLLERDLGITGDDGSELLEELQKRFGVSFTGADGTLREAFGLEEDEYLFHSEGMSLFLMIANLFGFSIEKVKPLSVAQLHHVILEKRKTGGDRTKAV
ncbi:DUF1493 family protein [Viridibacterium curvum]|uniref:Acyl carrier protein n=1 Tax=Viridibacterium curvum TaxID=1101404 RepID=A0ABP9R800_9RHOO